MKIWTLIAALALLPGCGDDGGGAEDGSSGGSATGEPTGGEPTGGEPTGGEGEALPPVTGGKATMRAWLDSGAYKSWKCQPASHDPLMPVSPHGKNRICSNAILSGHGDGEYPVDSAAVKELYADDGTTIQGYAVYRKVKTGAGESFYWYEDVPDASMAPHDDEGVVADGLGDAGPAQMICVGCHQATGLDGDHPGHDFVYIQVK